MITNASFQYSFLPICTHTRIRTEADLSVDLVNSQIMTTSVTASLFKLSNPVSLYSAVVTLAAEGRGSGETSLQPRLQVVSESEGGACVAVWLGEQYQPLLVSDPVDRSNYQ